jgi:hypothetical protein
MSLCILLTHLCCATYTQPRILIYSLCRLSGDVTAIIASLLLVVVGQVELLEQRTADGQRHVLEVAERIGEAQAVADAAVAGEHDAGAVPWRLGLGAVGAGALDEDDLADVLHVATLELDFVCAGLVGHAVDGALEDAGAEVLALQPDLGTCDRKQI